jgi:signal transduction histidine kinase/ActR/RegA family two-component response regulator
MSKIRLRTKFLLSLLAISAGLTAATLLVVSYSVHKRIRQSIREELSDSVKTYQTFEKQRESTLTRSAELLANLPTVRALMTTHDAATIQDESANIWRLSGSDLLVLADRNGGILALRTGTNQLTSGSAQVLLQESVKRGQDRDWWYGAGHLYEVWIQPVYFGPANPDNINGLLAVGHEIDNRTARDFSSVVSSEVVFKAGDKIVASTLRSVDGFPISAAPASTSGSGPSNVSQELQLANERYLVTTVNLSTAGELSVSLSVLKSFDKATAFLSRLNRILLGLGLLSVFAGGILVFFISHTFTRPLSNLVAGVHALEEGNFAYPLEHSGGDEVAEVTGAFDRMRNTLQTTQNEQRQLEERLRQAHKMEAVGRLAGGVAHDFNNLLTIIRGNSDILSDRPDMDSLFLRCVGQIQKASNRAVSMTRQLLAFSRMQVLQPVVLDLNTVVSEMGKMLPRLIGEHIDFSFQPESKLATVLADPGQIEQVLLNLAVNARDAMPHGGKLTVRTLNVAMSELQAGKRPPMTPGNYVLLAVTDTGHGMDEKTKAHIFEPFFTTKEIGKGTGLGLATVYGIVKQSGGFIWVESAVGLGTTFEIYLPASSKTVAEAEAESRSIPAPRGSETILVVEDEPGVRELACTFLRTGGYSVLEAKDGVHALELFAAHSADIHLVLADMIMPRMTGTDLAFELRSRRPGIRILFMTGYADFSENNDESSLTPDSVLQKPFSSTSLLEKIREALAANSCEHAGEPKGARIG